MNHFLSIVKSIVPNFTESELGVPFRDAGIDSIDLVTIRVEFEQKTNRKIPDGIWLNFNNIEEVILYCIENNEPQHSEKQQRIGGEFYKSLVVNMPQMAIEALSENWLFKELGGIHWDELCAGLGTSSYKLKDDVGNRLYATFVRIRIDCEKNLKSFKENDELEIKGKIKRFGESMYFSDMEVNSLNNKIRATLMTTFSIRQSTDNTNLAKSQPAGNLNSIESYPSLPKFGNDYRLLKKSELDHLEHNDLVYKLDKQPIYETEYKLNPYYDLNGVNLLYFAAYPIINDYCEASFFNNELDLDSRWEQLYYTVYKDIFYFANCNIDDTIIYRLIDYNKLSDQSYQIQSVLVRKSDNTILAKIFTRKTIR